MECAVPFAAVADDFAVLAMTVLQVNDAVHVERGDSQQLEGVVVYLGKVHFSDGDDWVGVRLTGKSVGLGKNDGCVKGVSYFSCGPNAGIFVRKSHISRRELTKLEELRLKRELAKQSPRTPTPNGSVSSTASTTTSTPKKSAALRTPTSTRTSPSIAPSTASASSKTRLKEIRPKDLALTDEEQHTAPLSPSSPSTLSRPVSPSPSKIPSVEKDEVEQLQKKVEALSEILRGKDEEIAYLQQSLFKVEKDLHKDNKAREEAMPEEETTFDRDLDELLSDSLGELDSRKPESDSERQERRSEAEQSTLTVQTRTNQRHGNKRQIASCSHNGLEMPENGSSETQIRTGHGDEEIEHVPRTDIGYVAFFKVFFAAKGGPQILFLGLLLSFGFASTIGVVPAVLSDRFARIHHGYDGPNCSDFDRSHKPDACQQGADDAQTAVVVATFIQNMLTLVCNTTVGSVSDARGRRHIMILSILLYTFCPAVLVLMQVVDSIDPAWYFVSFAVVGVVNWVSIGFSMLADVIPPDHRAASFGLFVASFYLGFCVGPSCVLVMDHLTVSVLSLTTMLVALLVGWTTLPETLPEQVAQRNRVERTNLTATSFQKAILRPVREMSILNRDTFFRLLTIAYFFSCMVHSSDRSLVLFYMEDQLNVRDGDLATMFFIMGIVGVVIQSVLLELLLTCLGEKGLLVVSFLSGTVHNLLYGLAKSKGIIYFALCLSQLTKTNFALVSSIASNNVSGNEQGRMQGALFALSALANAIGPVTLQLIYDRTKGGRFLGPGTMFVFASVLYFLGTCFVTCIPGDKIKPSNTRERNENDLEEPLLVEQSCDEI